MGLKVTAIAKKLHLQTTSFPHFLRPSGGQSTFYFLTSAPAPSGAVLTAALVMAVSLALLPVIERVWRPTGDEPHYLLAAHSLVADGDLDLTNNYDQLDYLAFYYSKDIVRQVRLDASGQQILDHQLGLPVLIAPAYALAGRAGVLAFQVIIAGLLAALTFKLAALVSRAETAALLAALAVSLGPLLLFYQYLIYPELFAALLTTLVLYLALSRDKPAPTAIALVLLSLLLLPWLNRRFIPLALLLALVSLWSWRSRPTPSVKQSLLQPWPWLIGLTLIISLGSLAWFNSHLSDQARVDITTPTDVILVWERLGRSIGWLVDQQRGLFIFAPVYLLALWGLPWLLRDSLTRRNRNWLVLLPFLLSLGVTTLAGGFWVAWEVGPRFLVVALPALAPLLALAWRQYARRPWWLALAGVLAGLTLLNGLVILRQPELPYKSSLPLYYGQKLGLPLTEWLPDLAGYERLSPETPDLSEAPVISDDGQAVWLAEPGQPVALVRSGPLVELPFGHYELTWPLRVEPGLPPETELLRLSAKSSGGGVVFNTVVTAADLPATGHYGEFRFTFANPNPDYWRTPLVFNATSTGQAKIWAKAALFAPDPFYAWVLPYLGLTLFIAAAGWGWYRSFVNSPHPLSQWERGSRVSDGGEGYFGNMSKIYPLMAWSVSLILPLAAAGYTLFQYQQNSRTYPAAALSHLTGRAIPDTPPGDNLVWLVDPQVDPPQKAIYGPFEIFDAGLYRVIFRLKLPQAAAPEQEVAGLQVNGAADPHPLISQPLRGEHFTRPNLYHDFVLTVDNPRRQALSFEVVYLGAAPLVIERVTISQAVR